MPRPLLARDATVASVLPTIDKPEDYLRVVIGRLNACSRAHGNARVCIGVTGTGVDPSYMIFHIGADRAEHVVGRFDRYNAFSDVGMSPEAWSTASMTYDEVKELFRTMRVSIPHRR